MVRALAPPPHLPDNKPTFNRACLRDVYLWVGGGLRLSSCPPSHLTTAAQPTTQFFRAGGMSTGFGIAASFSFIPTSGAPGLITEPP